MMKTKRLAVLLAVVLTLARCAPVRGDVIIPGQPYPHYNRRGLPSTRLRTIEITTNRRNSFTHIWKLETLSGDIETDPEAAKASVKIWTRPSKENPDASEMWLELALPGPGKYECAIRDSEGQSILSDKGINEGPESPAVRAKADFKTPAKGETARYALEASFVPYEYEDTSFGPKLIEGPGGGPRLGLRQELKRELVIENVSGDVRVRVEE